MTERLLMLQVTDEDIKFLESTYEYNFVGIYRLPKTFCECPEKQRRNLRNWARDKKTGIPLCLTCKRPSRVWRTGIRARLEVALGKDVRA